MLQKVRNIASNKKILVIADGAAFGPEMDQIIKYLKGHKNVRLYAPESFEWIILSANPLKDTSVQEILEMPSDYIDSSEFFSWEQFFTWLLTDKTQGTYLKYSKNHLNPALLKGSVKEAILRVMNKICFDNEYGSE